MFSKISMFVSANKDQIVQKGVIVVGAIVGIIIAGVVAKNTMTTNENDQVGDQPAADETDVPSEQE